MPVHHVNDQKKPPAGELDHALRSLPKTNSDTCAWMALFQAMLGRGEEAA